MCFRQKNGFLDELLWSMISKSTCFLQKNNHNDKSLHMRSLLLKLSIESITQVVTVLLKYHVS